MMEKFFAFFVAVFVGALWVTACDVPIEAPPVAGPETKYFVVTFETDGGSPAPEEQRVLEGAQVAVPEPVEKAGFIFDRWYEDAEFTIPWDFETGTVTANITLFAKWLLPVYTVTFVANGGSSAPEPQEVVAGGSVTQPDPMTKTGFGFGGWFLDDECTEEWDFANDTVDDAITLYAMWDANYHAVIFDVGETETTVTPAEQNIAFNSKAVAPSLSEKTGYKLGGWYTDEARTNAWDFNTDVVTEDITLYLNLAPIQYTIIFDANDAAGNAGSMQPLTLVYDSEQLLSANGFTDTRQFYALAGWNTAPGGGGTSYAGEEAVLNLTDVDDGEITLYAQWAMSASLLQAYITSQSDANVTGSVKTNPTPVALSVELSATNWGTIDTAMVGANMYVNLDLSGCTPSTAADGGGLRDDGVFNGATSSAGRLKIVGLTMPDTVVEIAADSFNEALNLTTINLPKVQTIGERAFASCYSLVNISLPLATTIGNSAFAFCRSLVTISLPQATTIGNNAFEYCFTSQTSIGLQSVDLPRAESIGNYAFYNCRVLQTVNLPLAENIGNFAFSNCMKIQGINLPNATSIGQFAFSYCDKLQTVSIPSAQSIGQYAFDNNTVLNAITLGAFQPTITPPILRDRVTVTVSVPTGVTDYDADWLNNSFGAGAYGVTLTYDYYVPE